MHRRYTIHKDGDLLVEDLDAHGKPVEPEPVPAEDRLAVEVLVRAEDNIDSKTLLLELLEMAFELEADGPDKGPEGSSPARASSYSRDAITTCCSSSASSNALRVKLP